MSPGVHLALQSCLEPRLMEPRPSRLRFDPPKSLFPNSIVKNCSFLSAETKTLNEEEEEEEDEGEEQNKTAISTVKTQKESEMGGWNFLQSLSSCSKIFKTENEEEKLYVYPLSRSSYTSTLSTKSLEMCTESLGSETGSDESESNNGEEIRRLPSMTARKNPRKQSLNSKRIKNRADFPPPLTSISGHGGVRMQAHRENGRLVLKAVAGSCCGGVFEVERGNGRLRLRLTKNCSVYEETQEPEEEEEEEEEEEIEGNSETMGGEMGKEKFPLPSRCKEGGTGSKRLLDWAEPFWVAT